jgi:hydroxymethylpyrimidine pyrophosphatase-like HAD family hydrolase/fructoselysine-6-P-deglycase FrlB-like protein
MGKPYANELQRLSETYTWALEVPIEPLATAISASASLPLLTVGSGGSFTAAHLACTLHQRFSGIIARPLTPLELFSCSLYMGGLNVMLLSAEGKNTDIMAALKKTISHEPRRCIVLCLRGRSPLSRLAQGYRFVDLIELSPPSVKDGFLATNSLLAFSVLLVRAYASAFSADESLPKKFENLLASTTDSNYNLDALYNACKPLWKRETIVVLYGSTTQAAALDLESKFSEAALGNVQLADFRNFAHGRHNWLAKRASKTGVLAIFADNDRELAERTLRLIPSSIPIAKINPPGTGSTAMVAAMVATLYMVGAAGEHHRVDPGRPHVTAFGRRIYGLHWLPTSSGDEVSPQIIAIARKLRCEVQHIMDRKDLSFWLDAYRRFIENLEQTSFGGIICDYDGTLCDERDRFSGLRPDITRIITQLLSAGILIGIATGRGKSVREDFRKVLPKELWGNVRIAYYNGADVATLSDDAHPILLSEPCETLKGVADVVQKDPFISQLANSEPRQAQVSVQPKSSVAGEMLSRILQQLAHLHGVNVLRSSHSIDLVRSDISKRSLLVHLAGLVRKDCRILLIGDKGQWPGNDFDLLAAPYSLSVDEVSVDPDTCWNLARPGHRGVQAAIDYLNALQVSEGTFRVDVARKLSWKTRE